MHSHSGGHPEHSSRAVRPLKIEGQFPGYVYASAPRNVYWEMTRACDLACSHCRAEAQPCSHPQELTTEEGKRLIDSVARMGSMLVLTGGDPLKRPDLFELIDYGVHKGVPVSVTPSTTPTLTDDVIHRFKRAGIAAMGVSLDGPNAEVHDAFRNVKGTFDCSMRALAAARDAGIPVQVNTTITARTLPHVEAMYELLREHAAPPVKRWSLFLLVPVGRGTALSVPTPQQIEELFAWVYRIAPDAPFRVGTVEAPHYRRYWIEQKLREGRQADVERRALAMGFGIRDGNGVIFVSHLGDVYPAGFLPYPLLGNVRKTALDELYRSSEALGRLRDADQLHGRCGRCEYRFACGGSRARGFSMTGDVLGEDPLCAYEPLPAAAE